MAEIHNGPPPETHMVLVLPVGRPDLLALAGEMFPRGCGVEIITEDRIYASAEEIAAERPRTPWTDAPKLRVIRNFAPPAHIRSVRQGRK